MALLKKVAIDTNMLTAILEFKIDVFEEITKKLGKIEFLILEQTIEELEKIKNTKGKEKKKAGFALKVLEKKKWRLEKIPNKNCDDALLELSEKAIVATNDKELKKRIKEKGGEILFIRQKKFIEFDG